jgi:signal transduction histidine kinase
MAKETAHQLGTPLSSIMGWLSLIREEMASTPGSVKLAQAVEEVSIDVDRLSKISARFSKIGSAPKLDLMELVPIIEETVGYFERRRPTLRINSTITTEFEELPLIRCSRELIGWVLENMIKNSLDAIAGDEGKIHIQCRMNEREKRVEILFSDSGKGMSPGVRKRIFSPGFTTKSRGWGLGLSLVKRIVEDIHGGSIRVLQTQPGKGTTFLITFPVD